MNMAARTQIMSETAATGVLQQASVTMMKDSSEMAENAMDTLLGGAADMLASMGLGKNIDVSV